MLPSLRSVLRRLAAETRGAEIAEAAAVLPLMFMMLLGIFWFGQAFSLYGAITRAAQEGARAGAAPYCATCSGNSLTQYEANAVNAVQAALVASKLNPALAQPPATPTVFSPCTAGLPTTCTTTAGICVQAPVELTTYNSGSTRACFISVSFQYPFQFWLPFTSLNQQRILIAASARVRLEMH
jgi:Flp pilus assembly protein TadG